MPALATVAQRPVLKRAMPRGEFVQRMNGLLVTPRLLWMPKASDTTTATTDETTTGRTVTWDATVAARLALLGRGTAQSFVSASTQWGTTPDTADMSFGTGAADSAVSFVALAKVADTAADRLFISKYSAAANSEYLFYVTAGDVLRLLIQDQSAAAVPFRTGNAVVSQGSWRLFGATYDGSGGATAANGITLYQDGAVIASTATNAAGYVAMENLAAPVEIGSYETHTTGLFDGSMALVACSAVALSAAQHAAIATLCRRYFGVPL